MMQTNDTYMYTSMNIPTFKGMHVFSCSHVEYIDDAVYGTTGYKFTIRALKLKSAYIQYKTLPV